MQTKHQIQLTRQELRDIIQALDHLLTADCTFFGRVATNTRVGLYGPADPNGEELAKLKGDLDRHKALFTRLHDQEFDIWKRELDDAHIKADAEEAARYADSEPEEIQ